MRTLELSRELADDLIALRRELHRIPELGLELPLTQKKVLEALKGVDGLEVTKGEGLSSVVAVLRGTAKVKGERRAVVLRGDMDALPLTEQVESDHVSEHEGKMHACGHDLHTAGLVGAARVLSQLRDEVAGDVILMFQPGEEAPGGAQPMLDEGLLDAAGSPVVAAYGLHVMSAGAPKGLWAGRSGSVMAARDSISVVLTGSGGHGSSPWRAKDPVPATCELVLALQSMVTRCFDVFDPVVLTVGSVQAGTQGNIIPDSGRLEVSLRSLSEEARAKALDGIRRVAESIGAAHDLSVEVTVDPNGYPVTRNDDDAFGLARDTVVELFGEDRFMELPAPQLGSEDMSLVLDRVPGAYLFVSASDADEPEQAAYNHSPQAAFDDAVLPDQAAWLAQMAINRLKQD